MPKLKHVVSVLALLSVAAPSPARADWLLTPYVGAILFDITDTGARPTVGGSISWMGRVAGFEGDFGDAPGFIENKKGMPIDQSNLLLLMGNVIVQFPTSSRHVRPYAVGGIGLLQTNVTLSDHAPKIDEQNLGFNLGGGLVLFFNERVGLRGDFRYFRALENEEVPAEVDALGIGELKFVRGSIGVVFRF